MQDMVAPLQSHLCEILMSRLFNSSDQLLNKNTFPSDSKRTVVLPKLFGNWALVRIFQ